MSRIICALFVAAAAVFCGASRAEAPINLAKNAPDRYVVVKGDTLWGIAGKFLQEPWRWGEIWQINKKDIKNPHLIYPGDIVLLTYENGRPRLRLGKKISGNAGMDVVKVEPEAHIEQIADSIPSIPAHLIEAFISRPLVVGPNELRGSPRIVGVVDESHVIAGNGDEIFVQGVKEVHDQWSVYRLGEPLVNPVAPPTPEDLEGLKSVLGGNRIYARSTTAAIRPWPCVQSRCDDDPASQSAILPPGVLGYEVIYLGNARLKEAGDVSIMELTNVKEEIRQGDYLLPAPPLRLESYIPRKIEEKVAGHVVSVYGGVHMGGKFSVISLSLGSEQGLEVGHVLGLYSKRSVRYKDENGKARQVNLPEKRHGLVFVFRVFDRVSYALVMEADRPLAIGDAVNTP
ncbi:MAG: LysM peptidoglycan-binding domain-containing protein [Zoogloeaceae bacterium]|nr:LysM peptidoglycan-binding domain-containing protein [Zoogloeaceae bacterium]